MPRAFSTHQAVPFPQWDIAKGLFVDRPGVAVPDGGCTTAENVIFSYGRVRPRYPLKEYIATGRTVPINHFYPGYVLGQQQYLMYSDIILTAGPTQGNMSVWYYESGAWYELTVSPGPTSVQGILNHPPASVQFRNDWLFCPGDDELYRWDFNAAFYHLESIDSLQPDTSLRPPNKPWCIAANATRVFLANAIDGSGNRNYIRVWWSATGNCKIWDDGSGNPLRYDAGYTDLSHEPSEIIGLFFHGGVDVLVFKRSAIYKLVWVGLPVGYLPVPLTTDVGALSHSCIRSYRSTLVWLGTDYNMYALPFRGQIQPFGDNVSTILENNLDLNYAKNCSATLDSVSGLYYFTYPAIGNSGVCKNGLICNLKTGAWSEWSIEHPDIAIMAANEYRIGYGRSQPVFGSMDGKLYTFFPQTGEVEMKDAGAASGAYSSRVVSKTFDALQLFSQNADTSEIHALSLQGSSGRAVPIFRAAATVAGLEDAEFQEMDIIDMDQEEEVAYTSGSRSDAQRFTQIGIDWESGDVSPMVVDGITSWIMPRGVDPR